jgi:hypothetical protein
MVSRNLAIWFQLGRAWDANALLSDGTALKNLARLGVTPSSYYRSPPCAFG